MSPGAGEDVGSSGADQRRAEEEELKEYECLISLERLAMLVVVDWTKRESMLESDYDITINFADIGLYMSILFFINF